MMASEEKIECLKKIDLCNEVIRNYEMEVASCNKFISQGYLGLLLGIVFFVLGWFFPVCFFGAFLGLAGIILLLVNLPGKRKAEDQLESNRQSLLKWKEKLYRLEN
jgi:hypothetical protein